MALYQVPRFVSHCIHGYDMAATIWQLPFVDDGRDFCRQVQEFLDGETIPPDDRLQVRTLNDFGKSYGAVDRAIRGHPAHQRARCQRGGINALQGLATHGLHVVVARNTTDELAHDCRWLTLDLVGNDHLGIIRDLAYTLAQRGISIEELQTACTSARCLVACSSRRLPACVCLWQWQSLHSRSPSSNSPMTSWSTSPWKGR